MYTLNHTVATCKICRSPNIAVRRNGDGLYVATCHDCGNTSQPERLATDCEAQLRFIPLDELPKERVL